MGELSHFNKKGFARMVDVTEKSVTSRTATATGKVILNSETYEAVKNSKLKKGDVLAVAQVAGIMGAKKTSELIPLCHILNLTSVTVDFIMQEESSSITAVCETKTTGKTGVEMEALTGVQISLLTIYDMCKALDKGMVISDIHLLTKSGGKSGDFEFGKE